ncbi:hypothetical protein [Amycolatopsis albispora]|uniref:Uncharacterized protein n=1 Tax=Amycolatopsis albispora TaxID=1804986 RepID=A0A344L6C4_9PSEU|nr:hypothetical protein [Amycolatopsis albispora]AXB43598.1 hypothetical protein A4R43_14505 [Amycolatopsis albispora]
MGWWNQPRDEKGRWTKSGTGLAAATVAGLMAFGGGAVGGGTASVGAGSGSGAVNSVSKSGGKQAAKKGQHGNAFRQLKMKNIRKNTQRGLNCAKHSFGDVQQFFLRTPCRELDRMLFAVNDEQGNEIAVSIAWVRMGKAGDAAEFKSLVDIDGTGNVSPPAGAALGLTGVEFTGRYYDSRRDGTLVVVAEAAPAGGRPSEQLLHDTADVASEFPQP